MTTAPPIAPAALLRPRRKIRGMSAILLPFRSDLSVDWDAFAAHVARTHAAGIAPAVNMDTGYVQLIDDAKGVTVAAASSLEKEFKGGTKSEDAAIVGKLIAERAKKAGVSDVVFDRGGYIFHGRVKALADAAREGGLKF